MITHPKRSTLGNPQDVLNLTAAARLSGGCSKSDKDLKPRAGAGHSFSPQNAVPIATNAASTPCGMEIASSPTGRKQHGVACKA
jgi:hypothetical protein